MKTNELRIGNIVSYLHLVEDSATYIDEVTGIDELGVSLKSIHPNGIRVNDETLMVKPLELTEDWLRKFGFKRSELIELYNHMGNQFHYEWRIHGNYWFEIIQRGDNFDVYACFNFIRMKHVHQLQNLYFSIYNEELTIKE